MKLSFSLAKPKAPAPPPTVTRPSAFGDGDDDDVTDSPSTPPSSNSKTSVNKVVLAQNVQASKAMKKRIEAEKQVDETVYEYDEVWDKMQEAKLKAKMAKESESKERKPKYIHGLLSAATTRKLDHLRSEEKMMQRERELEGDEFKDKETFVTQAYKDQMEQVRKAEEEEKRREELQKKQGGSSTGMAHFYRKLLEESEQQHEVTVAATQGKRIIGPQGPTPNLTITKPPELMPLSDLELAKAAREQGKEVEVNDDGQIVDKRDLLSAGLNLSLPNTRRLGKQQDTAQNVSDKPVAAHTAVGTAASRREINERRRREIMQQMEVETTRVESEKQKEEAEKLRRTVTKRNNESDVQSARERYLARKRQKLEDTASDDPDG
ncbi:hypothetical protein AGABI1DRAFT_68466 [Agaricus bisporus var. burnettii JB137-S8]|uniref:Nuclear speckle splicing regulatory protein 1 N-terminal domain-containing protein n=1 Tax=Agaricus bisporus var. burnettii (strain JB137-S8 / ATCC MYA-4627 / FGSC 10392) TaxID=597362 RepID=K5W755_AGABU|nr:uncharacterized protein AGABI1DRAFT_68466 [Agaricus bisporus var. burnettii JB137-S8]EKM82654.1 hypothetical protein AGABI1DRAFT_68466 [Agaricus bisporus var. burnettii JB137-S8]